MSITKSTFLSLQKSTRENREKMRVEHEKLKKNLAGIASLEKELKKEQAKGDAADAAQLNSMASDAAQLQGQSSALRDSINGIEAAIGKDIDRLIFSTDPRDQVAMLDDSYPIFLTPVRVETRFVTVKHIARIERDKIPTTTPTTPTTFTVVDGRAVPNPLGFSIDQIFNSVKEIPIIDDVKELWIRIFPDDIAVHTHENELTEVEINAAQTFWKHIWHAAADEGLRIGAWRGLVGGRGPPTPGGAGCVCGPGGGHHWGRRPVRQRGAFRPQPRCVSLRCCLAGQYRGR